MFLSFVGMQHLLFDHKINVTKKSIYDLGLWL